MTTYLIEGFFCCLFGGRSGGEGDERAMVFVRKIDGANFSKLVKVITKIFFGYGLIDDAAHI